MRVCHHLKTLEEQVSLSSGAKDYLIRCLERLLIAEAGCFDVYQATREVYAASLYAITYHRRDIACIVNIRDDSKRALRWLRVQRVAKRIENGVSGSKASKLTLGALKRINRPLALKTTVPSSLVKKTTASKLIPAQHD